MLDRRTALRGLVVGLLSPLGFLRGKTIGDKIACTLTIIDQTGERTFVFYRQISPTEYEVICPDTRVVMLMRRV